MIAEPVRWTPYVPPPDYWKAVRAACDKHGALLILDEIPNSLGRTGSFFTFEQFGVVPDMVVIGKPPRIPGVWVAFFRECQQYRCGQARGSAAVCGRSLR